MFNPPFLQGNVGNMFQMCWEHLFPYLASHFKHFATPRSAFTIILVNREPIYIRIFQGYQNSIARIFTNYFQALQLSRLFKGHKPRYCQLLNMKLSFQRWYWLVARESLCLAQTTNMFGTSQPHYSQSAQLILKYSSV